MKLPELFLTPGLEYDPDKVVSFHEIGHSIILLSEGLLPLFTSLERLNSKVPAFVSNDYIIAADFGLNWQASGPLFKLQLSYAGIIAGAWYSGSYDWAGAAGDRAEWEQTVALYKKLTYRLQLQAWISVHQLIEAQADLLQEAAEKLYVDRVLGWEYWESVLFTQ